MHPLAGNRKFRRLLAGRLVTNAGDSIYYVAALWLVHDITGSTTFTGLASFLYLLPGIGQFVVGPLVDRTPVRVTLTITQIGQGLLVLSLPVAATLWTLSVWHVLAVLLLASILNQVTYPAQSSALPRTVDEDDLPTANAVFNAAHEGVNMTFNALGGLLVGLAAVGATGALALDVGTFAVAAVLFAGLILPEREGNDVDESESDQAEEESGLLEFLQARTREYREELREGFSYLRGTSFLYLVVPLTLVSLAEGLLLAVLPAYAALRGGPELYGVLLSALAVGALLGSALAARLDGVPYGTLLIAGSGLAAASWLGTALTTWTPAIVALFVAAIVFPGGNAVMFDSLVQAVAPEAMIGRVTSAISTATNLARPLGSLLGGAVAAFVGPVPVVGSLALVFALVGLSVFVAGNLRTLPPVGAVDRRDDRIERAGD